MATFDFTVDTSPMAKEIDSVSSHVNATTVAVTAMQVAVIKAEKESTDLVCENLNTGFYTLMQAQLSQKVAKAQSDVDSLLLQLTQQKKALLGIRLRMERDYNMISRRYNKLFVGLNKNLKSRVTELDKPVIDFTYKDMERASNRSKNLTATVPVAQLESIASSQRIVASHVKFKGIRVINSMRNFLYEMAVQKNLTEQILINDVYSQKEGHIHYPVLLCESVGDKVNKRNLDIMIPNAGLNQECKGRIQNTVFTNYAKLKWVEKSRMQEIDSEFFKRATASDKSDRVKEMTMKLYQENNFSTI